MNACTTLDEIAASVAHCTRCPLHATRIRTVPGSGDPQAGIMLIGEGPGQREDEQGVPFVGRSGQLLTEMLTEAGLRREEIFITSLVKCRPPGNRTPRKSEITACAPFLEAQIKVIHPRILCPLGLPATTTLLDRSVTMTEVRGQWFNYQNMQLIPMFHPAYVLRNRSKRPQAIADFQTVKQAY